MKLNLMLLLCVLLLCFTNAPAQGSERSSAAHTGGSHQVQNADPALRMAAARLLRETNLDDSELTRSAQFSEKLQKELIELRKMFAENGRHKMRHELLGRNSLLLKPGVQWLELFRNP